MKWLQRCIPFLLIIYACSGLFDTDDGNGNNHFILTVEHDIERIYDVGYVRLVWDELSVDGFKEIIIERRQTKGGENWLRVGTESGRIATSYIDTIYDDEDLEYRVGIVDTSGNIRWAAGETTIPRTTVLHVPLEQKTPKIAFESPIIDSGDSILVGPGEYWDRLSMILKTVYMASTVGYENTLQNNQVIISTGVFEGFTVQNGYADHQNAGGIKISGTGEVRNCYIINNRADRNGGGVMLIESGKLYNSILFNNQSAYGSHNLYLTNTEGQVINNTFVITDSIVDSSVVNTNILMNKLEDGLLFLNNIVLGSDTTVVADPATFSGTITINYSRMDTSRITGDQIILGDPQFLDFELEPPDFHLAPGSPCINAGHPDPQYNNRDGTRNTLGAFGGPGGK